MKGDPSDAASFDSVGPMYDAGPEPEGRYNRTVNERLDAMSKVRSSVSRAKVFITLTLGLVGMVAVSYLFLAEMVTYAAATGAVVTVTWALLYVGSALDGIGEVLDKQHEIYVNRQEFEARGRVEVSDGDT